MAAVGGGGGEKRLWTREVMEEGGNRVKQMGMGWDH